MKKRLFHFATILSLLLFLLCGGLWIASYVACQTYNYVDAKGTGMRSLSVWHGEWTFEENRVIGGYFWSYGVVRGYMATRYEQIPWTTKGFFKTQQYVRVRHLFGYQSSSSRSYKFLQITTPLWPLMLACLPLPLRFLWLTRQRRRLRRLGPGFCQHCGYDLRGIASERCPECGTTRNAMQ